MPLLAAMLVLGCNYGFRGGGGFPSSIETIYIEPLENRTVRFELQELVYRKLLDELPRALGVQPAGRDVADAVVRGSIVRYDDVAQNYRSGSTGSQVAEVLEHQVQITVAIQIIDTERNLILWESSGVTGRGSYLLASQSDVDGRDKAVEQLAQLIVDGAQSQW